ncbi:MAG: sulfotransferase family 2 domain-containing protein [Halioglobus sp.]|nr:sulfotransferase family 2 domain-containing protein [Halioglobus sp.]
MNLADNKFLFIHVMKAGGTSFTDVINQNFAPGERYPSAHLGDETNPFRKMEAYLYVPGIIGVVNSTPERYRIVCGHVPYAIRSLLDADYVAITVLRDPVARTISYLKHCRRYHNEHEGLSLEEIYEDDWFHASFINNYQTKLFSMTAAETLAEVRYGDYEPALPPRGELGNGENLTPELIALGERGGGRFSMECFAASTGVIALDDARFETARENLRATDVVGVTEDYGRLLDTLATRYGWQVSNMPHRHAGEDEDVAPELKKRIARDNAMDTELHAYARSLAG